MSGPARLFPRALSGVTTRPFVGSSGDLILTRETGGDPCVHRSPYLRERVAFLAPRLEGMTRIPDHDELVPPRQARQLLPEAGPIAKRGPGPLDRPGRVYG